jgi:phage terminase large subunit-like protein
VTDLLHLDPMALAVLPRHEFDRWWATATPEDRTAFWLWCEEEAHPWRHDPATMSVHLVPSHFQEWAYWMYLGRKFREAVTGVSPRQLWAMPPRYGKSAMASQWGPAWALDRDPTTKIILVSYGDDLADENARATRDLLTEHREVLRAQLRQDVKRRDRFMTEQGGGVLGAGVNAAITGFGANGAVLDDLFKNWQEAHSEVRREAVDMAYKAVIRTRLEGDNPWQIVPMTRWHEDDIHGRLLERMEDGTGEAWEMVRIPAFAEAPQPLHPNPMMRLPDPLGRAVGEVLEPRKFSVAFERSRAQSLGTFLASALLQQRPAPAEGGEFKRAWWKIADPMPERYAAMMSSWDMKLKERDSGDFTVGQVWGRNGKDCYLVDQFRGRWTQATTACAMALVTVRHPMCQRHYVENAGYGPEVMEALRTPQPGYQVSDDVAGQLGMTDEERQLVSAIRGRGVSGLIPNNAKGSKVVRARAVASYVEAGDVWLNAHGPWLGLFLEEVSGFPQAAHDDQVDAMSQALAKMHKLGVRRSRTYGDELRSTSATSVGGPNR